MSMLAEPKRKQKWSLNPRGKSWAQDSNKFGQKMLEKMGWTHGKGLGANEDGMIEHIKVSYKDDNKGIGYTERDDQWTSHESNFSALLEALGGGELKSDDIKLNSLEEKSQNSRARVHYKKFTRGKDLSKYSEKDLANIFGKKNLKELNKAKKYREEQRKSLEDVKEDKKTEESESSRLFSNGGLLSDYFKKKLPNFGKFNGYVVGNNGVLKKADDSESESELRTSFGFGFKQEREETKAMEDEVNTSFVVTRKDSKIKSTFTSYIYENGVEETPKQTKKNKKKRNIEEDNTNTEDTPSKKKKLVLTEVRDSTPVTKKKDKSKRREQKEHQSGLSNPAFDCFYTPDKVEKHILEPIEESAGELLNETLNDTVGQVAESFEVQVQINNESTPVKKKSGERCEEERIKRTKKKDKTEDMEISYQNEKSLDETGNEIKKKKKKKDKNPEKTEEMDTSSQSTSIRSQSEENGTDVISKKDKRRKKNVANSEESLDDVSVPDNDLSTKSKKKKSKEPQEGLDNPLFNMSIESEQSMILPTENPYEVKIKEKKKKNKKKKDEKENYAVENPVFNVSDSGNSQDITNEEFEVKRKDKSKKKKKLKEESKGLDNPALNLNDTIDDSCDLMLNIVATPVNPKELSSILDESSSIRKVAIVKRRKSVRFSDVTRERIIPNKEVSEQETLEESNRDIVELEGKLNDSSDLSYIDKFIQKKKAKKMQKGLDNTAFDKQANSIEENITSISKTLDNYEAEIENDMNEAKLKSVEMEDIMVGEVGNPDGPNEVLPDGTVKLKFKNANFRKSAKYMEALSGAKKSYKHLIKGDIVMQFKDTNLHEIRGYAVKES